MKYCPPRDPDITKWTNQSYVELPQPYKNPTSVNIRSFTITGDANSGDNNTSITAMKINKTSYTFNGWRDTDNTMWYTQYSRNSSTTLTATQSNTVSIEYSNNELSSLSKPTKSNKYNTYSIIYNNNGGIVSKISDTVNKTIIYTFDHWNSDPNGNGIQYDNTSIFTDNTTVYAIWNDSESSSPTTLVLPTATKSDDVTSNYSIITYDGNGGTPSRDSDSITRTIKYIHNSWNSSSDGYGISYSGSLNTDDIHDNITLFAIFNIESDTVSSIILPTATKSDDVTSNYSIITYDGNGGTPSRDSDSVNKTIKYKFKSWNSNPNGTGIVYTDKSTFNAGNNTLYAIYDVESEIISSVTLPTSTRNGYIFKGWSKAQSSSQLVSNTYTPSSSSPTTLYSQWTPITYTIKFNGNSSDSGSTSDMSMTYDVSKNLNTNGYEKTNYNFIGWNTRPDGNGTLYIDGQSVSNLTYTDGETVTLYAQWELATVKYQVIYHTKKLDGLSYDVHSTDTAYATPDTIINLSSIAKPIDGFTYDHGSVDNETVISTTILSDGSRIIDLWYNRNRYIVNINFDSGAVSSVSGSGSYYYEESVTVSAEINNGYTWDKWTGTYTSIYNPYVFNMGSENVSLTVKYIPNNYTIIFDGNGSKSGYTENMSSSYSSGKVLNANGFILDGYEFVGWNTKPDGTGILYKNGEDICNIVTHNNIEVTLYAIWKPLSLVYIFNKETSEYDAYQMYISNGDNTWDLYSPYISDGNNTWDLY